MKMMVAVDLGGTNIRTALFDEKLTLIKSIVQPTQIGHLPSLLNQVKATIESLNPPWHDVLGISLGVPGRVSGTGKIDVLPNIKVFDVPLQSFLFDAFKKPIYVENDAVMAAIAEGNLGMGKQAQSSFFLTISTGIGGAFISNHQVKIASEEIGHTMVKFRNQFYELESIASGQGLIQLASLHGLKVSSPIVLFEQAQQKNSLALATLQSWLNILQGMFHYIQTTFQPEMVILTGGVLKSKHMFLDRLKQLTPSVNIQFSQFGQDAGLIGAAEFGLLHHRALTII
jgi:glucokinase